MNETGRQRSVTARGTGQPMLGTRSVVPKIWDAGHERVESCVTRDDGRWLIRWRYWRQIRPDLRDTGGSRFADLASVTRLLLP